MDLSILVPVYNFTVVEFVTELQSQARESGCTFEILCFDDFSEDTFKNENKKVVAIKNVFYMELPENLGRSKIRNLLAEKAKGEYLLFFDCDSQIISNDFILNYLHHKEPGKIIFGGRAYSELPPEEEKKILHWKFGSSRECIPPRFRKLKPYKLFMTNNFLIPQNIFLSIKMNEEIIGYGHEDTAFARELKKRKIQIIHIDNPLLHIGLEDAELFLKKSKQGISNLSKLIKNNLIDGEVKVFGYYQLVKKYYLEKPLRAFLNAFGRLFEKNLLSKNPRLVYFDLLKLKWLMEEMEK